MENTYQFRTSIMCSSCLQKVTSALDEKAGLNNWSVDLQSPARVLTVQANGVSEQEIIAAVQKAGFSARPIAEK